MRILYDLTYGTRGKSGIPKDTISVAKALFNLPQHRISILMFPKAYVSRRRSRKKSIIESSENFGYAMRQSSGRSIFPKSLELILNLAQAASISAKVLIEKLSLQHTNLVQREFRFRNSYPVDVYIARVGWHARFARPLPFRIDTSNFDCFIQQQLDPIRISRKTKHIVRLHDILPVTHPHLFDELSVRVFSKNLRKMLNQDLYWVFDTKATELEFKNLFESEKRTFAIPCAIEIDETITNVGKLDFVLMVNTIEPRKRVEFAINGFLYAKKTGLLDENWKFIVAGTPGWQEDDLVRRLSNRDFGEDIVYVKSPSNDEVQNLYKSSKILLSVPIAEGFGIPPLEGMAAGCIPVVSDIPQHRETMGLDNAFFLELETVEHLAKTISMASIAFAENGQKIIYQNRMHIQKHFSPQAVENQWGKLLNMLHSDPVK